MADFDYAQVIDGEKGKGGGLREEIVEHIYDITPVVFPEERFVCHEHTEADELEQVAGSTPRLFAVQFDGDLVPVGVGSNSVTTNVDRSLTIATIKIWYPKGEQWKLAASSDYWRIVRALINDRSGHPTNVCDRFVDLQERLPPEPTADGFFVSIPVRCIVEHTTS